MFRLPVFSFPPRPAQNRQALMGMATNQADFNDAVMKYVETNFAYIGEEAMDGVTMFLIMANLK